MINLSNILYMIPGAIIAFTIHEFVKAFVSSKLGDPLPKSKFRVTLNPMSHFEPIGFICMLMLGYGWGKPVETSPLYYKDRKNGTLLTYTLPSCANLLIGLAFIVIFNSVVLAVKSMLNGPNSGMGITALLILCKCLYSAAQMNIAIALFNIIPIYPLDGAKVLGIFLPPNKQMQMAAYEKILQIILVFLMILSLVRLILGPFENLIMSMTISL